MSRFVTLAALLGASRNYGVIDVEDDEPTYAGDGDDDGSDGLVLELSDDVDYGDDEYGDDDYSDDDYGDDEGYGDDDYGRRLSPEEREARRKRRKAGRKATRDDRRDHDDVAGRPAPRKKKMAMKLIPGSITLPAAGTGIITVRAQAQYKIVDLVVSGLAGSSVQYITNGENNALQAGGSFDISIFGATSFFRDLLTGQDWNQGTDLVFGVTLGGAGTVSVAIKVEYHPGC